MCYDNVHQTVCSLRYREAFAFLGSQVVADGLQHRVDGVECEFEALWLLLCQLGQKACGRCDVSLSPLQSALVGVAVGVKGLLVAGIIAWVVADIAPETTDGLHMVNVDESQWGIAFFTKWIYVVTETSSIGTVCRGNQAACDHDGLSLPSVESH